MYVYVHASYVCIHVGKHPYVYVTRVCFLRLKCSVCAQGASLQSIDNQKKTNDEAFL